MFKHHVRKLWINLRQAKTHICCFCTHKASREDELQKFIDACYIFNYYSFCRLKFAFKSE